MWNDIDPLLVVVLLVVVAWIGFVFGTAAGERDARRRLQGRSLDLPSNRRRGRP